MNMKNIRPLIAKQLIQLAKEHRDSCKDSECDVNTILIAEFLRNKDVLTRDEYISFMRD